MLNNCKELSYAHFMNEYCVQLHWKEPKKSGLVHIQLVLGAQDFTIDLTRFLLEVELKVKVYPVEIKDRGKVNACFAP